MIVANIQAVFSIQYIILFFSLKTRIVKFVNTQTQPLVEVLEIFYIYKEIIFYCSKSLLDKKIPSIESGLYFNISKSSTHFYCMLYYIILLFFEMGNISYRLPVFNTYNNERCSGLILLAARKDTFRYSSITNFNE